MKILLALALFFSPCLFAEVTPPDLARLKELDAYWGEVSRTVQTGDFNAYAATCHPEAVLVAGSKKITTPLADALKRWKKDFVETKEGKRKSRVEFKFSKRMGDPTTAHETGMFRYTGTAADGNVTISGAECCIHTHATRTRLQPPSSPISNRDSRIALDRIS